MLTALSFNHTNLSSTADKSAVCMGIRMKRKLIIISASVLVVCCAIYGTIVSHSQVSNNSYEYEYYYNNDTDSDKDDAVMNVQSDNEEKLTNNLPSNSPVSPATAPPIDTEPSSTAVLVNKEYPLPADYVPEDLVIPDILYNFNYYHEKKLMRQEAADALEDLFNASREAGLSLYGISGYRSYDRQKQIYDKNVQTRGLEETNRVSARPGYSEHQTGLSIDVSTPSINNRLEEVFAGTPEGKWLADNAHLYGFIIRYPKGKSDITGYSYEPWHIRYVGRDLAKELYDGGMTLEEYYNYKPSPGILDHSSYGSDIDVEENTDLPDNNPKPSKIPEPAKPTDSPVPEPTKEPKPTKEPEPTSTPMPTDEPEESATPEPAPTTEPAPTESPIPSIPPVPEETPAPEETPEPIPSKPAPTAEPTPVPGQQDETV